MFLDSHVEVLNGWLLYLLEEIQKDRLVIIHKNLFFFSSNLNYIEEHQLFVQ